MRALTGLGFDVAGGGQALECSFTGGVTEGEQVVGGSGGGSETNDRNGARLSP
jgi:hypothetical protein